MSVHNSSGELSDAVILKRGESGVLECRLHTAGGPLQWTDEVAGLLARAFGSIALDPGVRVVILTGTGAAFSGPRAGRDRSKSHSATEWERTQTSTAQMLWNMVSIDAPIISCVNGPALRHIEIPLLADIVFASRTATFEDTAHFTNDNVPGDGSHLIIPALMGPTRGRYFLLTGQSLSAVEALELGLVNEVHSADELLPRARAVANDLCRQNPLVLKYTRRLLAQPFKEMLVRGVAIGLALEGLATMRPPATDD